MARRLLLSVLMLVAGAVLLVAAALAGPAAEPTKGGTLRLNRAADFDYVDTAKAWTTDPWTTSFATCAKLFNYPDKTGAEGTHVVPEVATGYPTVSKDGRTYTFELRRTFRFHNGAPVTARSFADAFNRDANPKMESGAVSYMHDIVGVDAVVAGKTTAISGVRVLNRYRLQIRLTQPLGDLTARLTMPFFCPVLPNTRIDPAGIDEPAGSGPYYIEERIPNRRIVLKRNPYYRGSRPANADEIVWTFDLSQEDCPSAAEQNRIDRCQIVSNPSAARRLAATYGINRPGGRFFVNHYSGTWWFAFNHDRPAFKGPGQIPLKKAINFALDRHAIAQGLGYLGARRTDQMLPPALGRDDSIYSLKGADVDAARRWYARATVKPSKLVLYTSNYATGPAQVFAYNLKQIGIDVDVKTFDILALDKKVGTRGEPYDVTFSNWVVDYADPSAFFDPLLNGESIRPTGNSNNSYFDDPQVNVRIKAANRLGGAARRKAWADLDADLMRDDPPWAPFLHPNYVSFFSESFGCYLFHPIYGVDLAAACKK